MSYTNLVRGRDTPGRQKRNKAMADMMKPQTPRAAIEECRAVVSQHLQFPDNEQLAEQVAALVEDEERAKSMLKCDGKEAKKMQASSGDTLLRLAAGLCKRAKFVARMDSYNYKTRS